MLAEMAVENPECYAQLEKFSDARLAHIETCGAELRFERVDSSLYSKWPTRLDSDRASAYRSLSALPTSRAASGRDR
jgi:hypothetical protein